MYITEQRNSHFDYFLCRRKWQTGMAAPDIGTPAPQKTRANVQ